MVFVKIRGLSLILAFVSLLFAPIMAIAAIETVPIPPITARLSSVENLSVANNVLYAVDSEHDMVVSYSWHGVFGKIFPIATPLAVAADSDRLFVSSAKDLSVTIFEAASGVKLGYLGKGSGEFKRPISLAVDSQSGNIYVVDQLAHAIKVFEPGGSLIFTIDAYPNLPEAIAINKNELYLLEQPPIVGSDGSIIQGVRVSVCTLLGAPLRSFGGYGLGEGQLIRPRGIGIAPDGLVYISDPARGGVFCYSSTGEYLGQIRQENGGELPAQALAITSDWQLLIGSPFWDGVKVFGLNDAAGGENWANKPPEADAGEDFVVTEQAMVKLDGSASSDPEGMPLSFLWTQVSGSLVNLDHPDSISQIFKAPEVMPVGEDLVFKLTVSDDRGLVSAPAYCTITVRNQLTGSLQINNGDAYTGSINVTLSLTAPEAELMRFANEGEPFGEWQPFTEDLPWQLATGEGEKKILGTLQDAGGNTVDVDAMVVLDTQPPHFPSVNPDPIFGTSIIRWTAEEAATFSLEVADNPEFINSMTIEPIFADWYDLSNLFADGIWYWRVWAIDQAGNISAKSMPSIISFGDDFKCLSWPDWPRLISPEDYADDLSLTPFLTTGAYADPVGCGSHWFTSWQISSNPEFSHLLLSVNGTGANLTELPLAQLLLDPETSYFWRAKFWSTLGSQSLWSDAFTFHTGPQDYTEPKNGETGINDVNADGIADRQQNELFCVDTVVGKTRVCLSVAPEIGSIQALKAVDPKNLLDPPAKDIKLSLGLLASRIVVAYPGASAPVSIYFSEEGRTIPEGSSWLHYDPLNGWLDYSDLTQISHDRLSAIFELTDGGFGDADGVANGLIVDLSGPAKLGNVKQSETVRSGKASKR